MHYVHFGNTDMSVSRLCLGGMMFSRKMDYETSLRTIDEALNNGINFIDTAESYTDSEEYIGRALHGRRDNVFLATKLYTQRAADGKAGRNSRANISLSLDRSLKLLQTDRVDLYQLHHPDAQTPIDETMSALDGSLKQGKVRHVGVTNHHAWQVAYMIGCGCPIVSVQSRYNILDRPVEIETAPMAQSLTLAMMAYAPLCGGMLTGKYSRADRRPQDSRAYGDEKLQKLLSNDQAFDVIDQLRPIAQRNNIQLNQLAMLWLLAKPFITTPIVGGSKPEHFRPLYAIADRALPEQDLAEIDRISSAFVYRRFENQPVRELKL